MSLENSKITQGTVPCVTINAMNKLQKIESMGLKVSWNTINIGLYGYDKIPVLLTYDEVINYLDSLLTKVTTQTDDIITLMCEKDNSIEFDKLLKKFAVNEKNNFLIEIRKWRAYLLKNLLDNISSDYFQGVLELMEFWTSMGISDYCPNVFPSNNDKAVLENYFSKSSFDFLIKSNYEWLNQEIYIIRNTENLL